MQNKGAIKIIAVIFALVCLYQLSFTIVTKSVEKDAKEYANNNYAKSEAKRLAMGDPLKEQEFLAVIANERENRFLDSVSEKTVYNFLWMRKFNYKECKSREINLGLDLKGGMNVKMEVSTVDVVRNLATNPNDPAFLNLIDKSLELQKTSGKNFVSSFEQIVSQEEKIDLTAFFRVKLKDRGITTNSKNSDVISAIKAECTDAYERTFQVLSKRIDKFGVSQPTIQKLEASERILIELPGVKDPQRVSRLLEGSAQLEFWLAGDFGKVYQSIVNADQWLATVGEEKTEDQNITDTNIVQSGIDSILIAKKDIVKDTNAVSKNPLIGLFVRINRGDLAPNVVGTASPSIRKEIDRQLARASKVLPQDVMFLWSAKPIKGTNEYELYVIQHTNKAKTALLDGDVIDDARQDFDQNGRPVVSMSMKAEASRKWGKITGSNIGNSIAIVLDSVVYSAPRVNSEISGGRSEISGDFSLDEAKDLANILKSGKLTAPAKMVQESIVGPSLGAESISAGFTSFLIAFILICIYMLFFYSSAGIAACIALIVNLFFLFGILASIGAVLTLPGIAGIVLTLAMAVDANVIINERIKEEVLAGKNIGNAIHDGYKAAYSAIIDGNATTLITGIVLAYFASGSVQGFAITLSIGILTSLFSGIFISRIVFEEILKRKSLANRLKFYTPLTKNFLLNPKINFVGTIKTQMIIVIGIMIVAVSSIVFKGLDYGIDFSGGRTYVVRFDKDVNPNEIRKSLAKEFESAPEVKTFGPNYQVKITTDYKVKEDSEEVKREIIQKLFNGTKDFFTDKNINENSFESTLQTPLGIISSEIVGPTIADDIKRSAVISITISLIFIFIYIAIRFKKWQYGLGGLVALVFDTTFTIGMFSLFNKILPFSMDVDMNFIAAILTVIGYSINDTVIVFDRVRENVKLHPNKSHGEMMNLAMNQTLSRTVNTIGSTLIALIIVLLLGGEVLRGFAFALTIGITIGGFSSLFVASPIAQMLILRQKAKKELVKK